MMMRLIGTCLMLMLAGLALGCAQEDDDASFNVDFEDHGSAKDMNEGTTTDRPVGTPKAA